MWSLGASNFLSTITSTYTAMFSADLMPCTFTFPLISLALPAPATVSVRLTASAAFAAILVELMTFLSYSDFFQFQSLQFHFRLEHVVYTRQERMGPENIRSSRCGVCERLSPVILVFANDFHVGA